MENIFILVSTSVSFLASIPAMFYSGTTFTRTNESLFVITIPYYPNQLSQIYMGASVVGIVLCVCQLSSYTIMFVTGYIRSRGANSNSNALATQIKMALNGVILSISLTGIVLFALMAAISISSLVKYFLIYKIAFDFFSESNPYLLLLCSSHLRRKYFLMFSNAQSGVNTVNVIYHTQNNHRLTSVL
jgi:hypothetical protein